MPHVTTIQSGYDYIDTLSKDAYLDWISSLRSDLDTCTAAEQFFVVQYLWTDRLFASVEDIQYILRDGLLPLVLEQEDVVGQYLEYLYAVGIQNTKQQEDALYVRSVFATQKKQCIDSVTVWYTAEGTSVTQKDMFDRYIHSVQKKQNSMDMAAWMTSLQTAITTYANRVGHTRLSEEDMYEKTEELRQIIDFFSGVTDQTIYPLVLQTRFPELFDISEISEDRVPETKNIDIETTAAMGYGQLQEHITTTYGDITIMSPTDIAPVLTYLSEQAEQQNDPKINELIYFDTTTETFQWNDALLSSPA